MSISLPHGVAIPVEVEKFLASATDSILIDGERRPAASGETLESFDPGTGAPLTAIAAGDGADVDRAVSAAQSALRGRLAGHEARRPEPPAGSTSPAWSRTTPRSWPPWRPSMRGSR